MNWDQIADNWVAMTRRMRPSAKFDDAALGTLADRTGVLANGPARAVADDLKPFAREVA